MKVCIFCKLFELHEIILYHLLIGIRDVTTFPLLLLQTLEKIYGKEVLSKMWSDWIDIMHRILVENDGNICKEEVKGVKANTLIVNGANDPLIAKCHTSHLLNSIPTVQ